MTIKHRKPKLQSKKEKLSSTDYWILKQLEKIPEIAALVNAEYENGIARREALREEIRALEKAEEKGEQNET